jgi:hypothetical protein
MPGHVVLLGDSVFDNGAYVPGAPAVIEQLRATRPAGWRASLLALDGATTGDVGAQLRRVPADATHLVVSVGGNDALMHSGLLDVPVRSSGEVLDALAQAAAEFEQHYCAMLGRVLARSLPLVLCTIYRGQFPDAVTQRRASVALSPFNDAILRTAFEAAVEVIDLRLVCSDPADYANAIEPSEAGGMKIARAIARAVTTRHPDGHTEVFVE